MSGDRDPVDLNPRQTRRRFLVSSAAAGAALAGFTGRLGGTALAASPIKRGGRLRTAQAGGGAAETLSPFRQTDQATGGRTAQLFDTLTQRSSKVAGEVVPGLAESIEPNSDGSIWQIKLRSGVEFHNGKPFTADDVLYTWSYVLNPANNAEAAGLLKIIDMSATKKVNALTLSVQLTRPFATFQNVLSTPNMPIIPNGFTDFSSPIGTGPFKYVSFTPGQQSLFARNPNYWKQGKPYVDEIEMFSIDDDVARFNALLSNQVDIIQNVDFPVAKQYRNSKQITLYLTPATKNVPIYVRLDRAPFSDNRVREALKLLVDRQKMIDVALLGFGTVGNDLFGKGYASYNNELPQRQYDPEMARSLLKKAGHSNLNLELLTSQVTPGQLQSAEVYAQEAKKAGVKVTLKQVPTSAYFDTTQYYLKVPFAQSEWSGSFEVNAPYAFVSFGAYNETAWKSHSWDHYFFKAQGTLDETKRNKIYQALQVGLWQRGGYILWGFQDDVDAASPHVKGLVTYSDTSMFYSDYTGAWLA